jgi:hypothetical protein
MVLKKTKTKQKRVKNSKKVYKKSTSFYRKTRKYNRKYNRKYKTYSGGATPVGTPRTPRTPRTPVEPVTPLTLPGSNVSSNAIPTLASVAQQLQSYAYKRESPYYSPGKEVVPVTQLPGRGRTPSLTYEQQIHSTGDRFSDRSIEQIIKSPLKRKSIAPSVSAYDYAPSQRMKTARPPTPLTPPTPPEAVLTSSGSLKTTYTPSLGVVDLGLNPHITDQGIKIPRYLMSPLEYKSRVILPLSYLPLRSNIYETLTEQERKMLDIISLHHDEYSYLSPYIYNILESLHLAEYFGIVLVYGKLRDELMENIRVSSINTIQSRTQFSEEETKEFLKGIIRFSDDIYADTGPSPSMPDKEYPYEIKFTKIPTPKSEPSPTSLQVVGYNTHPMYTTYLTRDVLTKLIQLSADADEKKEKKKKEKIFILAHGAVADELSPELKLLANKYLRVIELGKKHTLLSAKYPSLYLLINNILLDPANAVMFENTDEGAKKRKEIFDMICGYIYINRIDACNDKDTLSLTDITHDRKFEGHFKDSDIQEDHDITMNTLRSFYSMGIFKPVDYRKKINRIPLFKKS